MARLVGYTMRLVGNRDLYWASDGGRTRDYKPVLSERRVKELWLEYANSGAFLQLPTVCPVYDYRRRC